MIMFQPPPPVSPAPAPARSSTPASGADKLGERLSRMTPGVGIRVPTVPPPPVAGDGVPPPVAPSAGDTSGARDTSKRHSPSSPRSMPDWVADPEAAPAGNTSAVLPAVDAPEKGVIDLLNDAFALYRAHAKVFILTAAILFIPGSIISSGALALITAPLRASAAGLESLDAAADPAAAAALATAALGGLYAALLGLVGWAVVALLVYAIVVPLTLGALTIAVADRSLGGVSTPWEYWRLLFAHLGRLISALVPAAILCTIGYFFFVIPGLVLSFLFVFVPAVVLIEGQSGVAALKRSAHLVRSDWIRVAIVLITFGVINFVAHVVGNFLIPDRAFFLAHLVGDLLTLILLPLPVLAAVLLYIDLRRKAEGYSRDALRAQLDTLRNPADGLG